MRLSERACERSLLTRHYHEVSVITHETAGQRGLRSRLRQGVLCPRNLQETFIRHSRQAGDSQRDPESRNLKRLLDAGFQAILRLAARRDAEHLERPPLLYTVPGIAAQPRSARSDSRNNGISRRVRC